jgi:DNA-binding winged helix-turn-helix (wHTH) protein
MLKECLESGFSLDRAKLLYEQRRYQEAAVAYRALFHSAVPLDKKHRLVIDLRSQVVTTSERWRVLFGRQHILLSMLCKLSQVRQGLTKAELVQSVWEELYCQAEHNNRLYYNMNRLRRLVEVDPRRPRYIISTRQGYALSPEVWVRIIGAS